MLEVRSADVAAVHSDLCVELAVAVRAFALLALHGPGRQGRRNGSEEDADHESFDSSRHPTESTAPDGADGAECHLVATTASTIAPRSDRLRWRPKGSCERLVPW
ncbi:MAG: hypothetical protein K0R38_606 [Polyangiaceae bacterium]|nr:hypothetical protein [Polyangiaceae bacterium]